MADKNSLLQFVAQQINPQELQGLVEQTVMELSQDPDVMDDGIEGIQELIDQLSYVAENPESYKDVLMSAIQAGIIDPADAPTEFDPVFVAVMILALEEIKARFSSQQFARGGLASAAKHLASRGRGGDTMLAHINPREAEVLRRMGGTGTINPMTGLPEFKGKAFKSIGKVFKSVAKAVVPIAATAFFGPVGGAIAGAATGAMGGGGLRGAILGGVTSSLIPGGFLGDTAKAVGSGLTSVLPSSIGNVVSKYISPATLGAGVLGGLGSSVAGQGFIPGALTAGGMAAMTPGVTGLVGDAKNYLTGPKGLFPSQADIQGQAFADSFAKSKANAYGLNPDAAGQSFADSFAKTQADAAANPLASLATKTPFADATAATAAGAKESGLFGTGITGGQLLTGVTALQALGGMTVPQAQMAIDSVPDLSPEQKEALNRELVNYSAQWNMATLPQAGTPEYAEMMNKIQQGIGLNFMNPTITAPEQPAMARGGALSNVAMLARGTGHGRSDTINARLSDGEYVIDAETVALLGNGSTKAGASALDQMREQLRKQKGKVLAKGKFSPDAKSPLAYMKGGLR
jgi:hypothetical protein